MWIEVFLDTREFMKERYYECSGCGNFSFLNSAFVPHWGVWVLDMLCQNPGIVSSAAQGTVSQDKNLRKDLFLNLSLVQTKHWRQPDGCVFPLATKEDVSHNEWRLLMMIVQLCEFWSDLLIVSHRPFLTGHLLYNMPEKISINHCWGEEMERDFHVFSQIFVMSGATHS